MHGPGAVEQHESGGCRERLLRAQAPGKRGDEFAGEVPGFQKNADALERRLGASGVAAHEPCLVGEPEA